MQSNSSNKAHSSICNFYASTNGECLWSDEVRNVLVLGMVVALDAVDEDEEEFGELSISFDTDTWDTRKHGLIYTNEQFMTDVQNTLMQAGMSKEAVECIDYSEQGMQGDNTVSCDVWGAFIKEARDKKLMAVYD